VLDGHLRKRQDTQTNHLYSVVAQVQQPQPASVRYLQHLTNVVMTHVQFMKNLRADPWRTLQSAIRQLQHSQTLRIDLKTSRKTHLAFANHQHLNIGRETGKDMTVDVGVKQRNLGDAALVSAVDLPLDLGATLTRV
jgi:hypothetical protein